MPYQSLEDVPSRYQFVHVVSRRARKLQGGAPPMLSVASKKPTRIAEQEALQGLVAFTAPPLPGGAAGEEDKGV
ncbi:MAG: DNA-directed RNA polymerase subunit omega [Terriglobales bacterium]